MLEFDWAAARPSALPAASGDAGNAELTVYRVEGFASVAIAARHGRWEAMTEAARIAFGSVPPAAPRVVAGPRAVLVWAGPRRVLVLLPSTDTRDPAAALEAAFGESAAVSLQGRCLFRLGGRARDAMAKLCSLDLDDGAFRPGMAAAARFAEVPSQVWRAEGPPDPSFFVLAPLSFAASVEREIREAGREWRGREGRVSFGEACLGTGPPARRLAGDAASATQHGEKGS